MKARARAWGLASESIHSPEKIFYLHFFSNGGQLLQPPGFWGRIERASMFHPPMALVPSLAQSCDIPKVLVLLGQGQVQGKLP